MDDVEAEDQMDTLTTQPFEASQPEVDTDSVKSDPPVEGYGSLVFVGSADDYPFPTQYLLHKDITVVGKSKDHDSAVDLGCESAKQVKQYRLMKHVSRVHFKIIREQNPDGGFYTVIEEGSRNGTFLGKAKMMSQKMLLPSQTEIGLGSEKPVFKYYEHTNHKIGTPNLAKKYVITSHVLGKGAFGEVFLGQERFGNKQIIAIKKIAKKKFGSRTGTATHEVSLQREVGILRQVKHPCCLRILDVEESPTDLFLVSEYCAGGEMFDAITHARYNNHGVGEALSKFYMFQIISALDYLHNDMRICHRDLKPENVLLMEKDKEYTLLKLVDFGMAKMVDEDTMLKTCVGTPAYMPPEILRLSVLQRRAADLSNSYNFVCDMWCLGVILFICLSGYPPFSDDYEDIDLHTQIMKAYVRERMKFEVWDTISETAKDFMLGMFELKQEKRMTSRAALKHPWFTEDKTTSVSKAQAIMDANKVPLQELDGQKCPRKRPPTQSADSGTMDVDGSSTPNKRFMK